MSMSDNKKHIIDIILNQKGSGMYLRTLFKIVIKLLNKKNKKQTIRTIQLIEDDIGMPIEQYLKLIGELALRCPDNLKHSSSTH